MKIKIKKYCYLIFICILFISSTTSYAHSGRNDSNGGHHDYQNKSGLGSYHYHHGYGPHLHEGGVCPYGGGYVETYTPPTPSISLNNYPSSLTIGENSALDFTVNNATSTQFSITSDNPEVVVVNPDNTLTAQKEGVATITITSSGVSSNFTLEVKPIPVSAVTVTNKIDKIQLGKSYQFESTVAPDNATYKDITWASNNEEIISIDKKGSINAKTVGTALISCIAPSGVKEEFSIEVFEVFPEKIIANFEDLRLELGKTQKLELQISPKNSNDKTCYISIENENIAQIDDDSNIKGIKDGKTKVIINTANNIYKEIPLEIYHNPIEKITINDSGVHYLIIPFLENVIIENTELELKVLFEPQEASIKDVAWKTSNPDIIKVKDGNFAVCGSGNVTLTVKGYDNSSTSIDFYVLSQATFIILLLLVIFIFVGIILCIYKSKSLHKMKK